MDLHTHKESIEHVSVSHPILGFILFWLGSISAFISLGFEQSLNDINLMLAILLKLFSIISIILSVVIYWDKITDNSRQIKKDIKDKLQKKK